VNADLSIFCSKIAALVERYGLRFQEKKDQRESARRSRSVISG
jgi:hypothetical protein